MVVLYEPCMQYIIMSQNYNDLPDNLPVPQDDGKTDHLVGCDLPSIHLHSTDGQLVNLSSDFQSPTILFIYPRGR